MGIDEACRDALEKNRRREERRKTGRIDGLKGKEPNPELDSDPDYIVGYNSGVYSNRRSEKYNPPEE